MKKLIESYSITSQYTTMNTGIREVDNSAQYVQQGIGNTRYKQEIKFPLRQVCMLFNSYAVDFFG